MPETGFTEILTDRLRLRRFRPDDLEAFVAYRDDEGTARHQGWDRPFTREQGEAFLAWAAGVDPDTPGQWFQYAVERRGEPGLIGDVAAHVLAGDPTVVEVGVTFAPEHRGRGYAAEALRGLIAHLAAARGKRRFEARCVVENAPVIALLERLGFVRAETRPADDGFIEHCYVLDRRA